jgi:hypothetical protein
MTFDERAEALAARLEGEAARMGMPATGDGRITEQALATLLGVHPDTVARWRQCGDGPSVTRLGGRCSYRVAAVAGWLLRQECSAARYVELYGTDPQAGANGGTGL